jgi:peptidoglycan/LPS O-acetylase OafA/YrhL
MHELLHPPGHRGPVIAAGAVVLTMGVALEQLRMDWSAGVQLVIVAALAVTLLWLAIQEPLDGAVPPGHVSVLAVGGLLALYVALLRLADIFSDPFEGDFPSGTVVWIGVVEAAVAAWVSIRRRTSVAALIAAVAGGSAFISLYDVIFDPGKPTPFRWLLLVLAIVYAIASLPLRGTSQRHAEQMINAAGLAIVGVWLIDSSFLLFGPTENFSFFWEAVILAAGLGLVAYAAIDHVPGAAYLGVANLVGFLVVAAGMKETLLVWPVVLLVLGAGLLAVGLRPRVPLPPPPEASTSPGDQPLAARTDNN